MAIKPVKLQIFAYFAVFLCGAAGIAAMIFLFSPANSAWRIFAGLYVFGFLAATGLAGLLEIFFRNLIGGRIFILQDGSTVFRQSALLGLVLTIALFFQANRTFNLYTATLLILAAGILELYFLNNQ